MNIVRDKGKYNDWEKINIVKGLLQHYNVVRTEERKSQNYIINRREWQFDDLAKNKINKLEKEYIARKQDEKQIIARRSEINKLLKNELLTENKRAELINEYNEIGLKWFANDDDELYESIIIASNIKALKEDTESIFLGLTTLNMLVYNYLMKNVFSNETQLYNIGVKDLTDIIMMMKYIFKEPRYFLSKDIDKVNIESLLIAINALILEIYDKYYQKLITPVIESVKARTDTDHTGLINYLNSFKVPQGAFVNLYNLFVEGLTYIDINEFLQVFPLEKDFKSGKFGCKDYFFSVESLKEIKSDEKYFKDERLTKVGARFFFSEISFEEKILEFIQVQMFSVISYGTDIDGFDLMIQFLNEAKEEMDNPKRKFEVIKNKD